MRNGWKQYKMGELVSLKQGFALNKKSDHHISEVKTEYPLLKISDLLNNIESLYVKDTIPKQFLVKPSEIIYSRTGQVGYAFMGRRGVIYNNCFKVTPNHLIDNTFLLYVLNSQPVRELARVLATGTAQPDLNHSAFKSIKVTIPPLPTQQKIANILSAYDDLIENNTKRIELLEEQAQLIYEEWFVRMKFPDYESIAIDEETGLPEGWERITVDDLLAKAKSTKKIKSSDIIDKGNIPVIDQSRNFIAGFTNDIDALIETEDPIIVFGDHTRILKLVNFNFARGADGTQLIISNSERMPQHLFFHALQAIDLSNYHYARHFKYLKSEEVILPDVSIANRFEGLVSRSYQLILKLRLQNQILREARDILLPRLMMSIIEV